MVNKSLRHCPKNSLFTTGGFESSIRSFGGIERLTQTHKIHESDIKSFKYSDIQSDKKEIKHYHDRFKISLHGFKKKLITYFASATYVVVLYNGGNNFFKSLVSYFYDV